jgi:TupA-like ATPgrasp
MENGVNHFDGKHYGNRDAIIAAVNSVRALKPGVPFLIEEFLQNWDGRPGAPYDFKFYNFGSRCAFLHVVERNSAREANLNRHWFLKPDWTPLGIKIQPGQNHCQEPLIPPPFVRELFALSQSLSDEIGMFIRVDLYATTRGPVFGEFTLNPHGGKHYMPDSDQWLGAQWRGDLGVRTPMFGARQLATRTGT